MGKPTSEQLNKINQLAKNPLTEDQVYVFTAKLIGDNMIEERYQRVTSNFLRKMADQAKAGVALLLDHSWSNLGVVTIPFGRTFDAKLQQEVDGELALYADHYIVRGQTFQGVSTDELISAIDAGTLFDTSVGFTISKAICSIDGLDYYSGKCMHYRGDTYDGQTCTLDLDDGSLMENSLVFDGAYKGAGVVAASKHQHTHDNKIQLVNEEDAKTLKQSGNSIFFSYSPKSGLNEYLNLNKSEIKGVNEEMELEQLKAQLSTANGLLGKVKEALKVTSDSEIEVALSALQANAKLGEAYKSKVVDETLGAGIRALGEAFNSDAMKLALSNLPVSEVEKIRDTYEAQAKAALGGGGKHVEGGNIDLPNDPNHNPQALSVDNEIEENKKAGLEALKKYAGKHMKEAN